MRRATLAVIAAALLGGACAYSTRDLVPQIPENAESSKIYAADGTLIHTLHAEENREQVRLDRVPVHVRDAVIAIEDERFWQHKGVDLRAIMRAVRANTEAAGIEQGGSTITQQLVKNTIIDDDQTLERKIQEASLAMQLERRYTKNRILALYLNTIYFGNGAYGVQAAANEYFGKAVDDLTLAEGALLAGLIQAPNDYDPFEDLSVATARRDVVLDKMVELGTATADQVAAAKAEPVALAPPPPVPTEERYPAAHFVEHVKQWILSDPRFGETRLDRRNLLFAGGLRIHTTVDLNLQAHAEQAVADVLPDPAGPDAAVVAIEAASGHVKAMVGGRDFFGDSPHAKLNLAINHEQGRQTGSAFKPFVLAAALVEGMPLSTTYPAPSSITLTDPIGKPWNVDNYGGGGSGAPVDLVEGTVRSYNTLYAQLVLDVGAEKVVELAADMGVNTTELEPVPSAALGTNSVHPLAMASAFGTFANRGVAVNPVYVTRISRADGTVLYESAHEQHRALPTDVADTVNSVLRQVIERGTGTAAQIGRPAAGKTGTNQAWRDAWFCGYTPQLSTAVWVGFPLEQVSMRPPRTARRVTGGSYPAQIWQRFMAAATASMPPTDFVPPPPPPPPPTTTTTATTAPSDAPPTTQAPAGYVRVPDVVGLPWEEAVATLGAYDLKATKVPPRSEGGPKNRVLSQSPAPGTPVPTGSTIALEVRN